jgi:hypothetical protein
MRRFTILALFMGVTTLGANAEMGGADLAQKLIEAHGGMKAWNDATILHFEHKMVPPTSPGAEEDAWLSVETIEAGSRRVYQSWPLDDAVVVFDGEEVWSTGWKRANPPKFMVHLAYYFLCLPFLTQDPGVNLEYTGMGRFPTAEKDYHQLRVTFDAGIGDSPDDYYVIFVDPVNYQMRGTEFVVTYGPMLDLFHVPADVTFIGPLFKVYEEVGEFDGLVMPVRYKTFTPDGTMYGDHWVSDYRFRGEFDDMLMKKPTDAVVDTSTNERKAAADSR